MQDYQWVYLFQRACFNIAQKTLKKNNLHNLEIYCDNFILHFETTEGLKKLTTATIEAYGKMDLSLKNKNVIFL